MKVWLAAVRCTSALLVLVLTCTAAAQQQQQLPHYTCKLLLQGYGSQPSTTAIAAAALDCTPPTGSGPMRVAINSTYLGQYALQLRGVHILQGSPCQQEAESAAGGVPIYALLYVCGSYNITLESLSVHGVQLQHDSRDWRTAVLLLGQGVRANILDATISNNTATHVIYAADNARLGISGATISGNQVREGVIKAPRAAAIGIKRSIFSHNTASSAQQMASAAGVSLAGGSSLAIRSSSFMFGTVKSGVPGSVADGGAVDASGNAQVLVENSTIQGGYASRLGGGVSFFSSAILTIRSSNITNNSAPSGGGLFVQEGATVRITDSRIEGNRAVADSDNSGAGDGGGLNVILQANVTIANSSISNNIADGQGGAIWASNTAAVTLSSTTCQSNRATLDGGCAFLADHSSLVVKSASQVGSNEAFEGGGVSLKDSSTLLLSGGSQIQDNTATTNGGGVSTVDSSRVVLASGAVTGNTAAANGGGLFTAGDSEVKLGSGVRVSSNVAVWGGGLSYGSKQSFNLTAIDAAVSNNTAQYNADRLVAPASLAIIGATAYAGFVSRSGADSSHLPVVLNVSGKQGLPCEGLIVQALLNNSLILGVNRSDGRGIVDMHLPIRVPPGQMGISFSLLPSSGQEALVAVPAVIFDLAVRSCQPGEVTPTPDTCQACLNGTYSLDPSKTTCDVCPEGAQCPGGTIIEPFLGFWHSTPTSHQVHRCPNMQACQGSRSQLQACRNDSTCSSSSSSSQSYGNIQCSPGYEGNLCGVCAANYGSVKAFTCRSCMGKGALIGLYVFAAVVLLGFIKLLCHYTLAENHQLADVLSESASLGPPGGAAITAPGHSGLPPSELIRPLVLYMQYMLVIVSMGVPLPAPLAGPLTALAWLWAPASPETLSADCLFAGRSSSMSLAAVKLIFYLCMPVAMLGILLVAEATFLRLVHSRRTRALNLRDRLASYAMVVAYFFTPAVMRIVFSFFACVPIDQPVSHPYSAAAVGLFWVHDTDQSCFKGYHALWALCLGLPLLVIVCGIMPAVVVWKTVINRHRLEDPAFSKHYGFLFKSYQPAYCWWEAVVLCQTAVLVAIGVFSYHLGAEKGLAMYMALAFIGVLLVTMKPYRHVQAGRVMVQSICCLFLTSTGIMSIAETSDSDAAAEAYDIVVAVLLLMLNVGFVLSVVHQRFRSVQWRHVWEEAQEVSSRLVGVAVKSLGVSSVSQQPQAKQSQMDARAKEFKEQVPLTDV